MRSITTFDLQYAHRFYGFQGEAQYLHGHTGKLTIEVEDSIEETLTYCDFPSEHWTRIRTNNVIERLNREIRRRTRVVGTFPD